MAEPALLTKRAALVAMARSWNARGGVVPARFEPPPARKSLPIDRLVAWAYREELPKAVPAPVMPAMGGGWDAVARWAEELSLAGRDPNAFGVVADPLAARLQGAPHADALAVHEAVQRLDAYAVQLPEDWNPFAAQTEAHLAAVAKALDLVTVCDGAGEKSFWIAATRGKGGRTIRVGVAGQRVLRTATSEIVRRAAIMGSPERARLRCRMDVVRRDDGRPQWFVQETHREPGAFGEAVTTFEVDGFDARAQTPKAGAYTKAVLVPDPVPVLVKIAEYELWRAAMGVLIEDLAGKLRAHEATPVGRDDG